MMWDRLSVPVTAAILVGEVEGTVLHPYRDGGGVWTIGCGATRDAHGLPVTGLTPPISRADALWLCQRDLKGSAVDLAALVTAPLDEAQASALLSLVYNLGRPKLLRSTLVWMLNHAEADRVPDELRKWNRVGGRPDLGLVRRRWTEAVVFLGGDPVTAWKRAFDLIKTVDHWPAPEPLLASA
jgi:lysozyme